MSGLKMMDFFLKIPADLTETTITGAALSVASVSQRDVRLAIARTDEDAVAADVIASGHWTTFALPSVFRGR